MSLLGVASYGQEVLIEFVFDDFFLLFRGRMYTDNCEIKEFGGCVWAA
jgi:hypothetical protein